ncbi:MAG: hypothetical protein ACJ79R_07250 [Anaeromyxobacteraceae bacterium]
MTTTRTVSRIFAIAALIALTAAPFAARADHGENKGRGKATNPFANIPVSGISSDGNTFDGTMNVQGFVTDEFGKTKAVGVLFGTVTTPRGVQQFVDNQIVTLPVDLGSGVGKLATGTITSQQLVCNVLNLVLGPLDLNLLGLTVHLNQVNLVVNAVAGAGALLGNLLCAVTNLLNGGILGGILTTLLNNLLGALAGAGL